MRIAQYQKVRLTSDDSREVIECVDVAQFVSVMEGVVHAARAQPLNRLIHRVVGSLVLVEQHSLVPKHLQTRSIAVCKPMQTQCLYSTDRTQKQGFKCCHFGISIAKHELLLCRSQRFSTNLHAATCALETGNLILSTQQS